jgi:aryl-alcohol dehydrogenase-like predicted oxidoreductase
MISGIPGFATAPSTLPTPLQGPFLSQRAPLFPSPKDPQSQASPEAPWVSRVGFGTYRLALPHQGEVFELGSRALMQALDQGCNLIDTAANYMDGQSEILIGQVLREKEAEKPGFRSSLVVVSKVGYVQGRTMEWVEAQALQGIDIPGVLKLNPQLWYCLSPEYIQAQCDRSLQRLQCQTLDVYLLHNPEYILQYWLSQKLALEEARSRFYASMEKAFVALESLRSQGKIKYYGVSSNSLAEPKEGPTHVGLAQLWELAQKCGSAEGFKVVQTPLNWLEPGFLFMPALSMGDTSLLEFAQEKSMGVLINRPFNAFYNDGLIRMTRPPAHRVSQAKSQPELQSGLANWTTLSHDLETLAEEHLQELPTFEPGKPLSQRVINLLTSLPGITATLCGMRRPEYVEDVQLALKLPKIPKAKSVLSQIFSDLEFHGEKPVAP